MRSPKNGKNVPLDSPRLPQPRTVNWTGGGRWGGGGLGVGVGSSRVSAVSLASQGADGSAAAGLGDDTTRGPRSSLGL